MMLDFPVAPPIRVKDSPQDRELNTLNEARAFVDDALALRRSAPWREMQRRLDDAKTEDDAIETIGALRELLMIEGLLVSPVRTA
jgi:hypothetical protein